MTEKSAAVGLVGIPSHQRKIVEQINSANSCAEVGHWLLRRCESLIMEFFDDGEARAPQGEGQCHRRESDEEHVVHTHLRPVEKSLGSIRSRSRHFPPKSIGTEKRGGHCQN